MRNNSKDFLEDTSHPTLTKFTKKIGIAGSKRIKAVVIY